MNTGHTHPETNQRNRDQDHLRVPPAGAAAGRQEGSLTPSEAARRANRAQHRKNEALAQTGRTLVGAGKEQELVSKGLVTEKEQQAHREATEPMPEAELDALLEEEGQLQAAAERMRAQGLAIRAEGQHQRANTQTVEAQTQHLEHPGSASSARVLEEVTPTVVENGAKRDDTSPVTQAHSRHRRRSSHPPQEQQSKEAAREPIATTNVAAAVKEKPSGGGTEKGPPQVDRSHQPLSNALGKRAQRSRKSELQRRSKEATARRTLQGLLEIQHSRLFQELQGREPRSLADADHAQRDRKGVGHKDQAGKVEHRGGQVARRSMNLLGTLPRVESDSHGRKTSLYLARRPSNMLKVIDEYEDRDSELPVNDRGVPQILRLAGTRRALAGLEHQKKENASKSSAPSAAKTEKVKDPMQQVKSKGARSTSLGDREDTDPAGQGVRNSSHHDHGGEADGGGQGSHLFSSSSEKDSDSGDAESDYFDGDRTQSLNEQLAGTNSQDSQIHAVQFEDTNINQLIHHNRDSGRFANIWSKLIFISHTYNFLTFWYFLGMAGFPEGFWLVLELLVELTILFDLCMRSYLKARMPNQWRTMWLLQDKEEHDGWLQTSLPILASLPQSLLFCLVFAQNTDKLSSFTIAALRSLKLMRFTHISKFFETKEIENQVNRKSMMVNMRSIQVVFYFLLATHMIGCIWLVIGRIDPNRENWFVKARYSGEQAKDNVREVTVFEKYIDAVFYTVATMTGLGYGNVVPSTNLEYFVDIFIMITGSSIYAGFFADFAVEIYNQNKKNIENEQKLEQAKQFATQRNLPDEIRQRIRLYYNNLRLNFSVLKDKFQILHQLPLTLRSELSLFFNCELIQKVKFFQLADPSFILTMSRSLTPQICLQKDFVVEVDQVATKMFFIEQGIVQILATDNKTVIAFQSQGCYFGEIGLLLTEKRSCSVKAVTMCIFMTIKKEELENIFANYPQQGKFLRAIGRQRLLTTKPEDLNDFEENIFEVGDGENIFVDDLEDQKGSTSNQEEAAYFLAHDVKDGEGKARAKSAGSSDFAGGSAAMPEADDGDDGQFEESSDDDDSSSMNVIDEEEIARSKAQAGGFSQSSTAAAQADRSKREDSGVASANKFQGGSMQKERASTNSSFIRTSSSSSASQRTQSLCSRLWCKKRRGIKWNLTEGYKHTSQFVIIPFSRLYNIWTTFMMVSTSYFLFMVPYQLALNYDIYQESGAWYLVPDIIFSFSFGVDIFLRSRLAFVTNQRGESDIQTNVDQIQSYYVNNMLIFDILAAIPFDYLLLPFVSAGDTRGMSQSSISEEPLGIKGMQLSQELLRFLRILKFFKVKRISETITVIKKHSNIPNAVITFGLFFLLYALLAHCMATSYIFIGQREVGHTRRFDGQTMFSDITGRNFITPDASYMERMRNITLATGLPSRDFEYLKPAATPHRDANNNKTQISQNKDGTVIIEPPQSMTKVELYVQFIYLSSCTMGAVMYGDIIPFAMSEQLFDFVAMFTCRMFLAFLFAEAASYLSSVHKSASQHTKKLQRIETWSTLNQLPRNLTARIVRFYEILWKNFRGVRQQHILRDLPESLRQDVRQNLFKNIIENWDVILDNQDNGVLSSIIQKLELRIIPQDELIIKYGEIAQEMYFIIKGQVNIISSEGIHLAQIGVGKNFGEMALLQEGSVRSATVQAATDVSVAIMSTQDFQKICDVYPTFKDRIMEVVNKRNQQNKATINKIVKQTIMNNVASDGLLGSGDAPLDGLKELKTLKLRGNKNLERSSSSSDDSESEDHSGQSSHASQGVAASETLGRSKDAKRARKGSALDEKESKRTPAAVLQADSTIANQPQMISEPMNQLSSSRSKSPSNQAAESSRTAFDGNATSLTAHLGDESRTHRQLLSRRGESPSRDQQAQATSEDEYLKVRNDELIVPGAPAQPRKSGLGEEARQKARPRLGHAQSALRIESEPRVKPQELRRPTGLAPRAPSAAAKETRKKFSRVSLRASGIQEHFNMDQQKDQGRFKNLLLRCGSGRIFMKWASLVIVMYNIIFIPLQFGYRIPFHGVYLVLEVFTVILYLLDIFYRVKNLGMLKKAGGNLPQSENEIEQTLMDDRDQFGKRVRLIKTEIACSAVALVPFSFIFQTLGQHEPVLLVDTLCLLRLVKVLPVLKLFDFLKSKNMQKWRVIEVVVQYYVISHVVTGIWISMGQFVPDVRETWIRRITVPQELGMRDRPGLDGVSAGSLYIHALYFVVNTVSHVAIGDITAVNSSERIFVAVLILLGTALYSFLYGNIVSIVSDFAPNQHITYFEKYQYVMQRLDSMKEQKALMSSINEYFDYIWGHEQGSMGEEFMSDLPQGIRSDILLCKYQEAIESSLIFKDDTGAIDVSLTNSIVKLMEIRIYMTDEFIFKVGSHSQDTFVVLEGQAVLVGACSPLSSQSARREKTTNESEVFGIMKAGCHFGTDLPSGRYNYGEKSICHMISRQPSVVGVLSAESLNILFKSFPAWKEKMQSLNDFVFDKCESNLKKCDAQIEEQISSGNSSFGSKTLTALELRLLYIQNHLTYSKEAVYHQIVEGVRKYETQSRPTVLEQNDLTIKQKMLYYGQEGKVFPIFDSEYQEALKKQSHESLIMDMLAGQDLNNRSRQSMSMKIEEQSKLQALLTKCWVNFYLKVNSKSRTIFDLVHTMNLLYIAVITPLVIGFNFEMTAELNLMELLSLFISSAWILANFRTQVLIKGVPTLKLRTLLKHYQANGLVYDILGVIPLNILLGQGPIVQEGIVFRSLLRAVRTFSSWRALQLFGKAEVSFKTNQFNIIMQVLKAFFYIFFLGHFLACAWYFTVSNIEHDVPLKDTWIGYHKLHLEPGSVQYLRSIYTIFNIVCSVGYGDMFPMTDIERIFFTAMITMGDLLFALAFGLITQITLQISLTNETKQFKDKMYQIQEFMNSFNLDQAQQRRVEQYFAYEYQQKYNSNLLVYYDLIGYLPYQLREEVIYQSSKGLLTSMFSKYRSENLIRKLACVLESVIFLPGDYIVYKEDIGDEMYFIAEGSVYVLADDKQTVITSLGKGCYFGEIALLLKTKRTSYVQAETFCIINILKKEDFDNIARNFPEIEKQLTARAAQRMEEIKLLDDESCDSDAPVGISGMNVLSQDELMQFHEDHIDLTQLHAKHRSSEFSGNGLKRVEDHMAQTQARSKNMLKQESVIKGDHPRRYSAGNGYERTPIGGDEDVIQEERSSQIDSSSFKSRCKSPPAFKKDEIGQPWNQANMIKTSQIEPQNMEQISQAIDQQILAATDAIPRASRRSSSSLNSNNQHPPNQTQQAATQARHAQQAPAPSPQHPTLNINIQNNYNIVVDRHGNQQQTTNSQTSNEAQATGNPAADLPNTQAAQGEALQDILAQAADLSIGKVSEGKSDGSKEEKMDVDDGGPIQSQKDPPVVKPPQEEGTQVAEKPAHEEMDSDEDEEEKRDVMLEEALPSKKAPEKLFAEQKAVNQQSPRLQRWQEEEWQRDSKHRDDSKDSLEEFFSPTNAREGAGVSSKWQEAKLARSRQMDSFNSTAEDHAPHQSFSQMGGLALGNSAAARKMLRKEPFAPVGRSTSSMLDGLYQPAGDHSATLTQLLSQKSMQRSNEQKLAKMNFLDAGPDGQDVNGRRRSFAGIRKGNSRLDADVHREWAGSASSRGQEQDEDYLSFQRAASAKDRREGSSFHSDRRLERASSHDSSTKLASMTANRRGHSERPGAGASRAAKDKKLSARQGSKKFGTSDKFRSTHLTGRARAQTCPMNQSQRVSSHKGLDGFSRQQSAVQQFMKRSEKETDLGTSGNGKLNFQSIFKDNAKQDINHSIRRIGTRAARGGMPANGQIRASALAPRPARRLSRIALGKNLTLSQTAGLKLQWTIT